MVLAEVSDRHDVDCKERENPLYVLRKSRCQVPWEIVNTHPTQTQRRNVPESNVKRDRSGETLHPRQINRTNHSNVKEKLAIRKSTQCWEQWSRKAKKKKKERWTAEVLILNTWQFHPTSCQNSCWWQNSLRFQVLANMLPLSDQVCHPMAWSI